MNSTLLTPARWLAALSVIAGFSLSACKIIRGGDKTDTTSVADTTRTVITSSEAVVAPPPAGTIPQGQHWVVTQGDSGTIHMYPAAPTRGGLIWMFAEDLGTPSAHCSFKGKDFPCYTQPGGVLATFPMPADEPGGLYTFQIYQPSDNGRPIAVGGKISVAEHDFGREIVLLDSAHYALTQRGDDIARDARVMRQVLSTESATRYWSGKWIDPVKGKWEGYGVLRFYYPATDSARAIPMGSDSIGGAFGLDTIARRGGVPSWRHAGADIGVAKGTVVSAPADGVVLRVGEYTLTGRTLFVDHGQGMITAYFHLDTVLVREGDRVRRGDRLARVGATGLVTGPHLHFGLYVHGRDVDPAVLHDVPDWMRTDSTFFKVHKTGPAPTATRH